MNMNSYSCCAPNQHQFNQVTSLSSLLKLVGEPSRLQILCILNQGQHCVCELEEHLNLSQSLVSHHLKDLKSAGLVTDQKQGLKVYYSLTPSGQKITQLLFTL